MDGAAFHPLVAFDFDGTLTCRDSFLDFLAWWAGPKRYALGMARLAPAALAYLGHRHRGLLKAAMVGEFLGGVPRQDLEDAAALYAAEMSPGLLRPDALRRWRVWQNQGARLIIVTASPETLVTPFARGLGAERLIGTRLAFDADDRVLGAFEGPNCRGREKVIRLREAFGESVRLESAYGDSDGDREMLAIADEPGLRVFHEKP